MKAQPAQPVNAFWRQIRSRNLNYWLTLLLLCALPFECLLFFDFVREQYLKVAAGKALLPIAPYPVFLVVWFAITLLIVTFAVRSFIQKHYNLAWVAVFLYGTFFYVFAIISDRALGIVKHDRNNYFFLCYSLFLAARSFFEREKVKS